MLPLSAFLLICLKRAALSGVTTAMVSSPLLTKNHPLSTALNVVVFLANYSLIDYYVSDSYIMRGGWFPYMGKGRVGVIHKPLDMVGG